MSSKKSSDSPESSITEQQPSKEATNQVTGADGASTTTTGPTQKGSDAAAAAATMRRDPFFEVSLSGLKLTNRQICSPILPAAYIAACSGVDNTQSDFPRGTPHAHRAAGRRFHPHTYSPERIEQAQQQLCAMDRMVNLIPPGEERPKGEPIFQVDPERTKDLVAISHQFIGLEKVTDDRGQQKQQLRESTNLASMLRDCQPWLFDISAEQAQVDMLQTYVHLMYCQDFMKFGGVDPRLASAAFKECPAEDNPVGRESNLPVQDSTNLIARFMAAPIGIPPRDGAAEQILGGVATAPDSDVSPQTRLEHAFRQLFRAGFLYRVAVLWNCHPCEVANAKPIVTLAVRGTSMQRLEHSAQQDVDRFLDQTRTLPKCEQFKVVDYEAEDGRTESRFKDSDVYRYVVPIEKLRSWVLLDQYRVRWWSMTDDTLAAFSQDAARVKSYITSLYQHMGREEIW